MNIGGSYMKEEKKLPENKIDIEQLKNDIK